MASGQKISWRWRHQGWYPMIYRDFSEQVYHPSEFQNPWGLWRDRQRETSLALISNSKKSCKASVVPLLSKPGEFSSSGRQHISHWGVYHQLRRCWIQSHFIRIQVLRWEQRWIRTWRRPGTHGFQKHKRSFCTPLKASLCCFFFFECQKMIDFYHKVVKICSTSPITAIFFTAKTLQDS